MLNISNIDLHYGAAQALRGISLKAEPGKVTCVLGRNGVGKTSLLRAIIGQHPISKGTITLGGADITKLSTVERARSGVALVPQGAAAAISPAASSSNWRSAEPLVMRPKLLLLDEPTEGIQPSIIKDIGRAICGGSATWRSCWSSNISTLRASLGTTSQSWNAARSSMRATKPA
jgi:urea transport system ATP-binding protein